MSGWGTDWTCSQGMLFHVLQCLAHPLGTVLMSYWHAAPHMPMTGMAQFLNITNSGNARD